MNPVQLSETEFLFLRAKIKTPFSLTVFGISMQPVLYEGDTILVCRKDSYDIGDILVFVYKNGEVLVHRLLKTENSRYYLKGDNAFRLEDISEKQIVGAVLLDNDPHKTEEFIEDSYQINRIFRTCRYDVNMTKQTLEYQLYHQKYLEM